MRGAPLRVHEVVHVLDCRLCVLSRYPSCIAIPLVMNTYILSPFWSSPRGGHAAMCRGVRGALLIKFVYLPPAQVFGCSGEVGGRSVPR